MITSISLQNFRRHRSLSVNFTKGLNVIRGLNEKGKTTIIEAACCALFGFRTLRTTLADTVTWGEKESSLKVSLTLDIGGEHTFTRSKSGATATGPQGVKVTGQDEVSAYAARLIGADAKTASMMMLASQSDLRGALSAGPTAISALMGKLANFDLIDAIVEKAEATLPLGNEALVLQAIERAEQDLQALPEPSPEAWERYELQRTRLQVALHAVQVRIQDELSPAAQAATEAYAKAIEINTRRAQASRDLLRVGDDLTQVETAQEDARRRAERVEPALLDAAAARVEAFRNRQAVLQVRESIQKLGAYPDVFWEGTRDEYEQSVRGSQAQVDGLKRLSQGKEGAVKALRGRLIKDGKCPTCGHQSMTDEHIVAHNASIGSQVELLQGEIESLTSAQRVHETDLKDLAAVAAGAGPWDSLAARLADNPNVEIDLNFYPPKVAFVGVVEEDDGSALAELKKLQDQDAAALRAQGEVEALNKRHAQLAKEREGYVMTLLNLKEVYEEPLKIEMGVKTAALADAQVIEQAHREDIIRVTANRDREKADYEACIVKKKELSIRLDEHRASLATLRFNNALMKKLKGLKPQITDYLWNTVLSAVSNFFSKLRGEASIVNKDTDGFKVNGQACASLSGSTLDVLALAIRVALTKTFVPQSSFVVLDEPAHGCDTERTGSVLGFLSAVGFEQTLLASHDELSESIADNVIKLEN